MSRSSTEQWQSNMPRNRAEMPLGATNVGDSERGGGMTAAFVAAKSESIEAIKKRAKDCADFARRAAEAAEDAAREAAEAKAYEDLEEACLQAVRAERMAWDNAEAAQEALRAATRACKTIETAIEARLRDRERKGPLV